MPIHTPVDLFMGYVANTEGGLNGYLTKNSEYKILDIVKGMRASTIGNSTIPLVLVFPTTNQWYLFCIILFILMASTIVALILINIDALPRLKRNHTHVSS